MRCTGLSIAAAVIACAGIVWVACSRPPEPAEPEPQASPLAQIRLPDAQQASPIRFTTVTADSGVDFVYYGNPSPEHYMTEQNGGGVALLDYDADGLLDLFLANGDHFGQPAERAGASHSLFRALGGLRYADVTQPAGLVSFGFGMGCAAGDYDNDGFTDLFLVGYGRNRLWHNLGDGTFEEVVLDPEASPSLWGTSAAFADLDGDGLLDLYVVNYVDYSEEDPPCHTQHEPPVRISCGPLGRMGQPDILYQNTGDAAFRNASEESGIARFAGKGLGVTIADFNDDGRLDVYVANDTTENLLFLNVGGLRFEERGLEAGVAVGSEGVSRSGMGVACADFNVDGRFDLVVTNFQNEPNDFYLGEGKGEFRAANTAVGLDAVSRPVLGFGVAFADFDLDGYPDLFVANGHVWDLTSAGLGYSYAMPPQLLRNEQGRRFADTSSSAGGYFEAEWLGRGTATGDLDNDGDHDLVVTHLIQPTQILRNDSDHGGMGIRVRLIGTNSARQALGVRVDVRQGDRTLALRVPAGDGFQSSSDPRLLVPSNGEERIDELRVHWPDGVEEIWTDIQAEPDITLHEGSGRRLLP